MIGVKEVAVPARAPAGRLSRVLLAERPSWQLLLLASAIGLLSAAGICDWSFVTGQHRFWAVPDSLDRATALVGYRYFLQTPWRLPLFDLPALQAPHGSSLIFVSGIPIVALAGKVLSGLSGTVVIPYGAYLFLCFALPGVMMACALIAAQVRCALAVAVGAIFADATPALLMRWPHMDAIAQFLLIGALALYLFSVRRRDDRALDGRGDGRQGRWPGEWWLRAWWTAQLILTYLIGIYLTAMVGIIWLCAVAQRRLNGLATTRQSLVSAASTLACLVLVGAVAGQFGPSTELPFSKGYGTYGMHLLSPVSPWHSGVIPGWSGVSAKPDGPFEGFNYLGLGLLLASVIMLPAEFAWLRRNLRRHIVLAVALVAVTLFAITNRVYVDDHLLFEIPLPTYVTYVLGIFRASGRFFWMVTYAQMVVVVVLGFRLARPAVAVCLAGAALMQAVDVAPMRQAIVDAIAAPPPPHQFDARALDRLVAAASRVEIVPSFQCLSVDQVWGTFGPANLEVMLATAKAGVPVNAIYAGRQSFGMTMAEVLRAPRRAAATREARRVAFCDGEFAYARTGVQPGDLVLLLTDRPRQDELPPDVSCSPLASARACVKTPQ